MSVTAKDAAGATHTAVAVADDDAAAAAAAAAVDAVVAHTASRTVVAAAAAMVAVGLNTLVGVFGYCCVVLSLLYACRSAMGISEPWYCDMRRLLQRPPQPWPAHQPSASHTEQHDVLATVVAGGMKY